MEPMARIPQSKDPYTEPSITVPVWITESSYKGLYTLINWLKGFDAGQAGRVGAVPGEFELVMFFREITSKINAANKAAKEPKEEKSE